jgi:hypothetical protein
MMNGSENVFWSKRSAGARLKLGIKRQFISRATAAERVIDSFVCHMGGRPKFVVIVSSIWPPEPHVETDRFPEVADDRIDFVGRGCQVSKTHAVAHVGTENDVPAGY